MIKYKMRFNLTEEILNAYSKFTYSLGRLTRLKDLGNFPHIKRQSSIDKILYSIKLINKDAIINERIIASFINDKATTKSDIGNLVSQISRAYKNLEKQTPTNLGELTLFYKTIHKGQDDIYSKTNEESDNIISIIKNPMDKETQLRTLLFDIKRSLLPSVIKALVFHYEFLMLMPFKENNILMANLWQSLFLVQEFPILNYLSIEKIYYENKVIIEREMLIDKNTKGEEVLANPYVVFMLEKLTEELNTLELITKDYFKNKNDKISLLLDNMTTYPESAKDLLEKVGLKSLNSFRKNYLYPAIREGLIKMTIPDKPNSRNQKYYKV